MSKAESYIYRFGGSIVDGDESMRDLLGGKGAGLAEMAKLGVPLPPGFTIGTNACRYFLRTGALPPGLEEQLEDALRWLENVVGRRFEDATDPLLVSVRSGSVVSMPGMMDTILNVGLTRDGVAGLAQKSGSLRFAQDSYRRLLQMMGTVVFQAGKADFDGILYSVRLKEGVSEDSQLSSEALAEVIDEFEEVISRSNPGGIPQCAKEHLYLAVHSVFESWENDRAKCYRKINGISDDLGTAVTIQSMVFGNSGPDSGTGVGFTRNPSTGEREIFGEFLINAQGEDIVAGVRTPMPLSTFANDMPRVFSELSEIVTRLESHYRDAQDFEFTVEQGKLFLLQTRFAKRSAIAGVRIAVDMVNEGLITKKEAVQRIRPSSISEILAPKLDILMQGISPITVGIPASPGAAVGRVVFSANEAVRMAAIPNGEPVILVTHETTAEDIHGMAAAAGFLTANGGATSHAAVVARGMGKCCITGAKEIHVNEHSNTMQIGRSQFSAGDWISLDASTGRVFAGKLPMRTPDEQQPDLDKIIRWAIELNHFDVRANADTPDDAKRANLAQARGIGLCRTEHMFFGPDRLPLVRGMILAPDLDGRRTALDKLLPFQQADFEELFRQMSPLPVTIRLLDPPLHEFLPALNEVTEVVSKRIQELAESNPMMGHRGCRLSITYPEILQMQVRAILRAAIEVKKEGFEPKPEIMVPLVASAEEMKWLKREIDETAILVFDEARANVSYLIGAMIELPRAALCAGEIAQYVSFASFGTNDLTQMTYGFSRDDASRFLNHYLKEGIFNCDPFVTIDRTGVGVLIRSAICDLRTANPSIKIGVCGEHAGDPESIEFFASLGVNYISCSPARAPIAQLVVAQL